MATDEKYLDNLLQSMLDSGQKQTNGPAKKEEDIVSADDTSANEASANAAPANADSANADSANADSAKSTFDRKAVEVTELTSEMTALEESASEESASREVASRGSTSEEAASRESASKEAASKETISEEAILKAAALEEETSANRYDTGVKGTITPETLADMVDRLDEILLEQSSGTESAEEEKILNQQDLDSLFEEMDSQFDFSVSSDIQEMSESVADQRLKGPDAVDLLSGDESNGAEIKASELHAMEIDPEGLTQEEGLFTDIPEGAADLFADIPEETADLFTDIPEETADLFADIPEETADLFVDMPEETTPEESPDLLEDLLAGLPEETDSSDEILELLGKEGLPESTEPDIEMPSLDMDEMDIGELLGGMGDDEDLSEIKGLLDKAESNELVDDDMMALLDGSVKYGNIDEVEDNDDLLALLNRENAEDTSGKGKKKEKKKPGKRKKKSSDEQADSEGADDSLLIDYDELIPEKDSKKSFFKKFFSMLTDADDDREPIGDGAGDELAMISDENQEILDELAKEDKKSAKAKKSKKAKKDKSKGKDDKSGSEIDDIPEKSSRPGREEAEEEDKGKKKKPKKEKVKKPKEPEIVLKKEKKVSKKKVLLVFAFCFSIMAAIVATSRFIPDYQERAKARTAYLNDDYKAVYDLLYGKNLSKSDAALYNQSYVILQMERSRDSYRNYTALGMPAEALHALFQGVARYEELRTGDLYGAEAEVAGINQEIQDILLSQYNVSGEEALTILSYDDAAYSHQVYLIALGIDYWAEDGAEATAETAETAEIAETAWPEEPQDLLPEEADFIKADY